MEENFLEEYEREYYKEKLMKEFPQYKEKIQLMGDIELMNIYDSNNWGDWFN